jgi:transposase
MGTARRQFTDEFKLEAVGLLASSGRPLSQIARELGVAASMLRSWREAGDRGKAGSLRRCVRRRSFRRADKACVSRNGSRKCSGYY